MTGQQWIRLDTNLHGHDKTLWLVGQRHGYQALAAYVCGLTWCGAHGTDGHIPARALPFIHATQRVADLLEQARMWERAPDGDGWIVRNWDRRQNAREGKQEAGRRAACARWHDPGCDCWKDP